MLLQRMTSCQHWSATPTISGSAGPATAIASSYRGSLPQAFRRRAGVGAVQVRETGAIVSLLAAVGGYGGDEDMVRLVAGYFMFQGFMAACLPSAASRAFPRYMDKMKNQENVAKYGSCR